MMEIKQVNIKVDTELWHAARVAAVKKGITLRAFIEQAIRDALKKDPD